MSVAELTRWCIWISLTGYTLSVGVSLLSRSAGSKANQRARLAWTLGCLFLWLHVAAAFHAVHGWSHAAALEQTARETEAVTGVRSGAGIYFNYVTMFLWALDALWWWAAPVSYAGRSLIIGAGVQGWLAFMIINATVVFESGPIRWIALAATGVLAGLLAKSCRSTAESH